jgi:hypothetical protein
MLRRSASQAGMLRPYLKPGEKSYCGAAKDAELAENKFRDNNSSF